MSGETDLKLLLSEMKPCLHPDVFVYVHVARGTKIDPNVLMVFQEDEGTTIILREEAADAAELEYTFPCRMITLTIHSSLEAVGFLAAISEALTKEGISTNPISGYFHDHLFVPQDKADAAMKVLHSLS